ncbi:MAG TPA: methyltransferase domain-containing protein [Chloroflexia bacterium]|nr:methyltransferase domain-containing protein [Chloroflexia bacterium]
MPPTPAPAPAPGAADDPRRPGALPAFLPLRFPSLPYANVRELLDDPDVASPQELRQSLRDIRMANLVGQGTAVVLRHLSDVVGDWPAGRPLQVLDLATGSGDIPRAIVGWARRRGLTCQVLATDISPAVLRAAQDHTRGYPEIALLACDSRYPPFPSASFDLVTCSLALHHLDADGAVRTLGNMARLARHGFIVNDVERSWPAYLASVALVYGITRNRLTRHDGPASVQRAFTRTEIRQMATAAGIRGGRIVQHAFWRIAFVGRQVTAGAAAEDAARGPAL